MAEPWLKPQCIDGDISDLTRYNLGGAFPDRFQLQA
uniref:Uncharacterized protein n=1 Tax=Anguilla anguilla TaxID=7936 RepID=A0A0E9Q2P1_ANGAN